MRRHASGVVLPLARRGTSAERAGATHLFGAFVNLAEQTFQQSTPMEIDNLIPFRLNASTKVQGSQLRPRRALLILDK